MFWLTDFLMLLINFQFSLDLVPTRDSNSQERFSVQPAPPNERRQRSQDDAASLFLKQTGLVGSLDVVLKSFLFC